MLTSMKLSRFKYRLPEELVAQHPSPQRDEARLMVIDRKTQAFEHRIFKEIGDYFSDKDVMVFNNTKVFPARLYGNKEKTGAKIEVFLLRELNREQRLWDVQVDPARKIRIGNKLYFGENEALVAEVIDNTTSRGRTLRFLYDGSYEEFRKNLELLGEVPLPRTIRRKVVPEDKDRFQTIYAKLEGAIAAPTAGIHFSRELLKRLEIKGLVFTEITLHIGLGNFRQVDVEDLTKHKMDSEQIIISDETAKVINEAREKEREVCAIGTTVLRTLESSVSIIGKLKPFDGWTNKFIFPPHEFHIPTRLVTNFHIPLSTMMMTAAAFTGYDLLMEAYRIAVRDKYRFGPYGDSMLVL